MSMFLAIVVRLVDVYTLLIFIYVLLSWVPTKRGLLADVDNVLGKLCDPYLNLFKRLIPPIGGMLDISPIVAILALQLVVRLLFLVF